jgi:hypothetical protein
MSQSRDFDGPGEQVDPTSLMGEARAAPAPDGETLSHRPRSQDTRPPNQCESPLVDENDPSSETRRTSTERAGWRTVRASDHLLEQRLDHSAHDLQRENTFDAVPDDAGPHSDKI